MAMAVDMFGDRSIADHPKDAMAFTKTVMSDAKVARQRFEKAIETLKMQPNVDKEKIAAIGYCFGGSVVLEMARQGLDLDGVVSFHGGLMTPTTAQKGKVKAKMLVLNGADDPMVKPEHIESFKKEMKSAGADFKFINLKGATHGFSNPAATEKGKKHNLPVAYSKKADKKSWKKMKKFFRKIF